ncbi:hypothetical protein [Fimbriimonas ginsengisoli]|uniref:Glycoside hydrolase family 42 N-terminal domain-containing protein n=1 Tax=Fimbriimonas ginsengisoli Gsoil 348 TaxID=661478 RepID=A0A068NMS1_FIMGI|nr:hypothetical protein [Fimbriimonas ginsengisoli]AIE84761.1 hypothetical protein OP10G_1393 [Fimbriimonas ginsengisoli Gsoil 348]
MKMKGLRVDPGFLPLEMLDPAVSVPRIVADCKRWGVDTIFVFAFSPVFGAFYFTELPGAWRQQDLAASKEKNFLPKLIAAAHAQGIKVVASFRLNQYERIATAHPDWRVLRKNGQPYEVDLGGIKGHPLSAWHPGYRAWFSSLMHDVVTLCRDLDGLEACEGTVAEGMEHGDVAPDYNAAALADFNRKHPGAPEGDLLWKRHRAEGMTGLHEILLHASQRLPQGQSYAIHDLVTERFDSLNLMNPDTYADECGFDFKGIASLGYDRMIQGAIWQQREQNARLLGKSGVFTPQWTDNAVKGFAGIFPTGKPILHAHVEVTPFLAGSTVVVTPQPADFEKALGLALAGTQGSTVYSYHQLFDAHPDPKFKGKKLGPENEFAKRLSKVYRLP